jgi:pSer/pThr/pTyr-binding forkhead associated (FHA) protein
MYVIEAMNGPLDGKRWPFERDITIGRDERVAQAALTTDRAVSRRHAAVHVEDGALVVVDAGSSNGTIVGGQAITEPVRLEFGQSFRIGATMLRVLEAAYDR